MKNKGFTLIELIAVVVMMGLILLIVFPITSRIMRDNESQEYQKYYEIVNKAVELYSRTRKDDIGGYDSSGCIDDTTISELVKQNYIKGYLNDDGIECKSPGDFTEEELAALEINPDNYVNIRIENKNGIIKTKVSMICKKKDSRKVYYKELIEKDEACERYVAETSKTLYNTIADPSSSKKITSLTTSTDFENISFVTGQTSNNYVWYSGKMWRIIEINTSNREIKLITDNVQTLLNYSPNNSSYPNSNVKTWLDNVFYGTLNNPNRYLVEETWDPNSHEPVSGIGNPSLRLIDSRVGLLNSEEYNVINPSGSSNSYMNNGTNYWLVDKSNNEHKNRFVNLSGAVTLGESTPFYGVRPCIYLASNVSVLPGGDGTINNPYRLIGDSSGNIGALLKTRIAGEYVRVNGMDFRIVSKSNDYTRLVATTTLNISDMQYHYYSNLYSDDTYVAQYLNNTWATPIAS